MEQLSEKFLFELYKLFFRKIEVIEICVEHLKYEYISQQELKKIWQAIRAYYMNNTKLPTIGIISQQFLQDLKTQKILSEIKETDIVNKDDILLQLEEFIKRAKYIEMHEDMEDVFNEGKTDQAYTLAYERGKEIYEFSLKKDSSYYQRVFADFPKRQRLRELRRNNSEDIKDRIPFGIDELDYLTRGGIEKTELCCLLSRSGVGKTKFLRHCGVHAARKGLKVVHIQLEGSKRQCESGYDATWSAIPYFDLENKSIESTKIKQLLKTAKDVINIERGEIYIHAYEQFNAATVLDVRNTLKDIERMQGKIDLVLIDYLELLDPGDGIKYSISEERFRRIAIANKMKNVCIEFDIAMITATQANDVSPSDWDDPEYVMTRHNTAESKGLINPFSFFLTANQTRDEYRAGVMRLYVDKFRNHRAQQIITIAQHYATDRFFDRKRTREEFFTIE